ncbi:hypothetical protein A2767_03615 [Candidatus Roizmanbacteria bacterium RIFCSPHIGHO2_01_FULL_35_10]|uniref:ATP-cone domain-containing protein n=1 Tax=Candidatus Roizmanbacteria bacterium RIFCSPLOWO2_01_FULL_35_13 TaxID=1802055 RepID=A0A1F7IA21_9BACT|nr:MAG: hypothetical protein A2767_03615 [Candidatus Roizmanbacteria bacterium RIFCSPHIGHO2_01_FULL_35_10]OGK40215.1 MAG: hypothetical protein A3A74_06935 [Candidatus Roizmanbacteria bacterium RIFCSPLOWO2_01_FULL_35_13]
MNLQVIKRDGSIEEYSEFKIIRVMIAAGLKPDKAQSLTHLITKLLKSNSPLRVSSLEIRDKVIQELKKIDKDVVNLYSWYEKTKE